LCASWSVISHGGRIIRDIMHTNTLYQSRQQHMQFRLSFMTEAHPWKITVNNYLSTVYSKTRCRKNNRNGVPVRLKHHVHHLSNRQTSDWLQSKTWTSISLPRKECTAHYMYTQIETGFVFPNIACVINTQYVSGGGLHLL